MAENTAIVFGILGCLGAGGIIGWWFTHRFGLGIAHKHRVIEEHTRRVHEYADKYYIRVMRLNEFIEEQLTEILYGNDPSSVEEGIKYSLLGFARVSKLEEVWINEVSATLMLKDRVGERLIGYFRYKVEESLNKEIGCIDKVDDGVIREAIDLQENPSHFMEKIKKDPLKRIYSKYKTRIKNNPEALNSLICHIHCLHRLWYFELNSCFDAWYSRKTLTPCFGDSNWKALNEAFNHLEDKKLVGCGDRETYMMKIGRAPWTSLNHWKFYYIKIRCRIQRKTSRELGFTIL